MYILVVEDERRLVQVVRKVLEEEGHTVDVAYDGEDGLAMALDGSHDVIVLDILLPGIDGIEVCRRLRSGRVDTPVLLLTALDRVEDRVGGLDAVGPSGRSRSSISARRSSPSSSSCCATRAEWSAELRYWATSGATTTRQTPTWLTCMSPTCDGRSIAGTTRG